MLFYGERSAVLFGRWKYIVHHDDGREELYDLERDPAERTPLQDAAALAQGRGLLARLREEATQRRGELGLEGDERAGLSNDLTRGLQELGYVK
jgi:arylsulfatase A-like enzyme